MKQIRPPETDLRRPRKGNLAGVMTGEGILNGMKREQRIKKRCSEGIKTCSKAGSEGAAS